MNKRVLSREKIFSLRDLLMSHSVTVLPGSGPALQINDRLPSCAYGLWLRDQLHTTPRCKSNERLL